MFRKCHFTCQLSQPQRQPNPTGICPDPVGWAAAHKPHHLSASASRLHPLGPRNVLVFACGPLAGTLASSVNRLSVGAKSPLTGGIKESNAGGTSAYMMGLLGIRAIVLEDIPAEPLAKAPKFILFISTTTVRFDSAAHLAPLGVYERALRLRADYGGHVGMSLIGPVGDRGLYSAGITNADPNGVPSRYNGRGGLGAVMGAKGLCAIVYDVS